jgi:DNA-binding ferritin-like protein
MHSKKQEIIDILKNTYNRDLRKQVVKTIQQEEKENKKPNYNIINQIFSYVLKELNWTIATSTKEWDNTPLDIMEETFPKIESTKWFEDQILTAKKMIETEVNS